jgi:coenzyme F420-reducing hydrogenase beta subunit
LDEDSASTSSLRRQVGRKIVRKVRAKAYRKIKKQKEIIVQMKRKIESLKKKIQRRNKKRESVPTTP